MNPQTPNHHELLVVSLCFLPLPHHHHLLSIKSFHIVPSISTAPGFGAHVYWSRIIAHAATSFIGGMAWQQEQHQLICVPLEKWRGADDGAPVFEYAHYLRWLPRSLCDVIKISNDHTRDDNTASGSSCHLIHSGNGPLNKRAVPALQIITIITIKNYYLPNTHRNRAITVL